MPSITKRSPRPRTRPRTSRLPRRTRARKLDHAAILRIISLVARTCAVSPQDFLRYDRRRHFARARHLAIATVYQEIPAIVIQEVGEVFHRDACTVRCSIYAHERLVRRDPVYRSWQKRIQQTLHPS